MNLETFYNILLEQKIKFVTLYQSTHRVARFPLGEWKGSNPDPQEVRDLVESFINTFGAHITRAECKRDANENKNQHFVYHLQPDGAQQAQNLNGPGATIDIEAIKADIRKEYEQKETEKALRQEIEELKEGGGPLEKLIEHGSTIFMQMMERQQTPAALMQGVQSQNVVNDVPPRRHNIIAEHLNDHGSGAHSNNMTTGESQGTETVGQNHEQQQNEINHVRTAIENLMMAGATPQFLYDLSLKVKEDPTLLNKVKFFLNL